jgi:dipeptidyl aminopeptidase/acylaminoacyl peptidase
MHAVVCKSVREPYRSGGALGNAIPLRPLLLVAWLAAPQASAQQTSRGIPMDPERAAALYVSNDPADHSRTVDIEAAVAARMRNDSIMETLTRGVVDYRKVSYRSRVGDLDIPAYVYEPIEKRGARGHPALVWVHGGVHSNWGTGYWPFVREAVERGYVVIAPEYRGSTGYGKEFHDAFDYGGYEVDDATSAYDWLVANLPHVDPDRVTMMGWSHGGYISLLAASRPPHPFQAIVANVPVTNLIFRLSYKGPSYQHNFSTGSRIRGLPFERREEYVYRSPFYQVDHIDVPVLVHVATDDQDVDFEEAEMLIHKLRQVKPHLAETRIYEDPGGHSFDRLIDRETWMPRGTPAQRDSWNRIWAFLEWNLRPYLDGAGNRVVDGFYR